MGEDEYINPTSEEQAEITAKKACLIAFAYFYKKYRTTFDLDLIINSISMGVQGQLSPQVYSSLIDNVTEVVLIEGLSAESWFQQYVSIAQGIVAGDERRKQLGSIIISSIYFGAKEEDCTKAEMVKFAEQALVYLSSQIGSAAFVSKSNLETFYLTLDSEKISNDILTSSPTEEAFVNCFGFVNVVSEFVTPVDMNVMRDSEIQRYRADIEVFHDEFDVNGLPFCNECKDSDNKFLGYLATPCIESGINYKVPRRFNLTRDIVDGCYCSGVTNYTVLDELRKDTYASGAFSSNDWHALFSHPYAAPTGTVRNGAFSIASHYEKLHSNRDGASGIMHQGGAGKKNLRVPSFYDYSHIQVWPFLPYALGVNDYLDVEATGFQFIPAPDSMTVKPLVNSYGEDVLNADGEFVGIVPPIKIYAHRSYITFTQEFFNKTFDRRRAKFTMHGIARNNADYYHYGWWYEGMTCDHFTGDKRTESIEYKDQNFYEAAGTNEHTGPNVHIKQTMFLPETGQARGYYEAQSFFGMGSVFDGMEYSSGVLTNCGHKYTGYKVNAIPNSYGHTGEQNNSGILAYFSKYNMGDALQGRWWITGFENKESKDIVTYSVSKAKAGVDGHGITRNYSDIIWWPMMGTIEGLGVTHEAVLTPQEASLKKMILEEKVYQNDEWKPLKTYLPSENFNPRYQRGPFASAHKKMLYNNAQLARDQVMPKGEPGNFPNHVEMTIKVSEYSLREIGYGGIKDNNGMSETYRKEDIKFKNENTDTPWINLVDLDDVNALYLDDTTYSKGRRGPGRNGGSTRHSSYYMKVTGIYVPPLYRMEDENNYLGYAAKAFVVQYNQVDCNLAGIPVLSQLDFLKAMEAGLPLSGFLGNGVMKDRPGVFGGPEYVLASPTTVGKSKDPLFGEYISDEHSKGIKGDSWLAWSEDFTKIAATEGVNASKSIKRRFVFDVNPTGLRVFVEAPDYFPGGQGAVFPQLALEVSGVSRFNLRNQCHVTGVVKSGILYNRGTLTEITDGSKSSFSVGNGTRVSGWREVSKMTFDIMSCTPMFNGSMPFDTEYLMLASGNAYISGSFKYIEQSESAVFSEGVLFEDVGTDTVKQDYLLPNLVSETMLRRNVSIPDYPYVLGPSRMLTRRNIHSLTPTFNEEKNDPQNQFNRYYVPAMSDLRFLEAPVIEEMPPGDGASFTKGGYFVVSTQIGKVIYGEKLPIVERKYVVTAKKQFYDSVLCNISDNPKLVVKGKLGAVAPAATLDCYPEGARIMDVVKGRYKPIVSYEPIE